MGLLEFALRKKQMEAASAQAKGLMNNITNAPMPYQMSEEEMFPGEQPIQGLQNKGTGLLDTREKQQKLYQGLLGINGYENIAAQGLMGMNKSSALNPTGVMQNLVAAGYDQGSPEYQQAMRDYLAKPNTSINMGSNIIKPSDALNMRDRSGNPPPVGATYADIQNGGYRFVNKQAETEARKESETIGSAQHAFDTYKNIISKQGAMSPIQQFTNPDEYNKLTSAYASMQLEYKELAKLGVLAGPDMDLIERVIQDPTSIKSNAIQYFSGTNPLVGQLDIVGQKLAEARKRAVQRFGKDWKNLSHKTVKFGDLK